MPAAGLKAGSAGGDGATARDSTSMLPDRGSLDGPHLEPEAFAHLRLDL